MNHVSDYWTFRLISGKHPKNPMLFVHEHFFIMINTNEKTSAELVDRRDALFPAIQRKISFSRVADDSAEDQSTRLIRHLGILHRIGPILDEDGPG